MGHWETNGGWWVVVVGHWETNGGWLGGPWLWVESPHSYCSPTPPATMGDIPYV